MATAAAFRLVWWWGRSEPSARAWKPPPALRIASRVCIIMIMIKITDYYESHFCSTRVRPWIYGYGLLMIVFFLSVATCLWLRLHHYIYCICWLYWPGPAAPFSLRNYWILRIGRGSAGIISLSGIKACISSVKWATVKTSQPRNLATSKSEAWRLVCWAPLKVEKVRAK